MNTQRIGLAAAAVAVALLSACSTQHPMTGGPMSSRGSGPMPGSSTTAMPGMPGMPMTGHSSVPNFRSYDECRAWIAQLPADSKALNRGPMQGGEVTLADRDLCDRLPRS